MIIVQCPYCHKVADLVNGSKIYPHRKDLANRKFYLCKSCDAYVGTHVNSKSHAPLGTMANAELRALRSQAHKEFDPLWKEHGLTRTIAYSWLARAMKLHYERCHIGSFTKEQCLKVIEFSKAEIKRRG